jgi:hypothetical protein
MFSVRISSFVAWWMSYVFRFSQYLANKSDVSEVINLVSYVLQQLVCVIFKYQTFLQNFKHCWGWYVQLLENILDWSVWAALAASSLPSGTCHSLGRFLFQYNLSSQTNYTIYKLCFVGGSFSDAVRNLYVTITDRTLWNFMKPWHLFILLCLRCRFKYCLMSSNEEKARQLLRPACIYCANWKHRHDFWTNFTVAVVTLCISEY